jgi:cytochrome c oxidase assembly protein subunit 15
LWLVIITLTWGAFVAGLRAGLLYNTWPLMDGHIAPQDFWFLHPWWLNFFENHGAVQFTHRCLAYVASLMCISIGLVTFLRKVPMHAARWGYGVAAMGFFQPMLGIITLLTHVDIHAAVAHQAGAFVLMGLLVIWCFELRLLRRNGRP